LLPFVLSPARGGCTVKPELSGNDYLRL